MSLSQLQALIGGVVRHPSADPRLTLTLVAIAVLVLAIIVVLGLLVMPRRKRRVRKIVRRWVPDVAESAESAGSADAAAPTVPIAPAASETVTRRKRRPRWVSAASTAAIPILVVAALASAYGITGTDDACVTCHSGSPAMLAVHENDHAGRATCVDCHERGASASVVGAIVARTEMVIAQSGLSAEAVASRPVSSAACVRCHAVSTSILESRRVNIRVSHAEPLSAGMNCVDCHGDVGHLGEPGRVPVSMDRCLGCHDGETAAAACATCHTTDIAATGRDALVATDGRATGSGEYQYPTVVASDTDCSGCHEVETQCDPCHGLRLPHPERFVSGYHAADAAFEKKESCYRCHDTRDCQSCHAPFSTGHASNWRVDHTRASWDAGCGCHGRGTNADTPICVFCHENAPTQSVRLD